MSAQDTRKPSFISCFLIIAKEISQIAPAIKVIIKIGKTYVIPIIKSFITELEMPIASEYKYPIL